MARIILLAIGGILLGGLPVSGADLEEPTIEAEDREHWSFQPLQRPALPSVQWSEWTRTPIDYFVLSQLESVDLRPAQEAPRTVLIRRLYFDLLGIPPSPREVKAFLNDRRADAYERLVDHLLASPHYGERWAQHWLDLARFAETDGFEHDKVRAEAWRYRDWVIDSLNDDMPYDRFVSLQLAGDELEPGDQLAKTATAFCLSGPDMPDINLQDERRHYLLNEITSTVGATLLGLQIGCAQCHDHKYDPISQADFYRMRALFEPAVRVKRNRSIDVLHELSAEAEPSHLMVRGDFRRPGPTIEPGFPRIADLWQTKSPAPGEGSSTGRRRALAAWITRSDHPLTARVFVNRVWQYHFGLGLSQTPSDFGTIGDEPIHLQLLDWLATELVRQRWSLKHLHRLLVTSATYRQQSHSQPTPEAAEQAAWNNRLEEDPGNLYLARFQRQRLSGEAVRDAMLAAAGMLDSEQGGPGVRPPLPPELVQTLLKNQWKVAEREAAHYRRSIYVFARRNLRYPIFEAFDRPDANASCPRRSKSTTAPQSLLLLNSDLSLQLARHFAGRVIGEASQTIDAQIDLAVRVAFGRPSSPEERATFTTFVARQAASLRQESREADELALPLPDRGEVDVYTAAALTDLCLALFNANEFLYID